MIDKTMKVYVVYQTDAQLSYNSRDLIAVCGSHNIAVALTKRHAIKTGEPLSKDDKFNIENISQTQGREFNYHIEEVECNSLL